MKVRTAELTNAALDWAVAKALGLNLTTVHAHYRETAAAVGGITAERLTQQLSRFADDHVSIDRSGSPSPISQYSLNWAHAGPLIERELIQLTPLCQDNPRFGWAAAYKDRGEYGDDLYSMHRQRGKSPLFAAMRCFVTSKLGEVVEIPDSLVAAPKPDVAAPVEPGPEM